jgi:DNA-binding transcriptional LysR family regulator
MPMELRHLRYFVTVAHEGHITRAAEKLNMQQPPLSQQIRALEREVDAALFVRHPRGVTLTDAGRSFLADAESILAQAEHAKIRARRTARGETGRIAVGFTTSAPFHPLVARAIREFRHKRPDVCFVLEESSSGELVSGLRDERLDIAFIRSGLVEPQGIDVHPLLHEDTAVAFPARHPLARRPSLSLKELANETFILYRRPDGRGLYDVIIAACSAAGFSPHVGQEAPRIVSTLNLVAAGLGITIVPASLSRLPLEGVIYRPLRGKPALRVPLNLACRRDERSAATLAFIELARRLPA